MITTLGFAAGASLPLLAGAIVGVLWRPPRWLVAVALAFAAGTLISAVSFELFEESYSAGGTLRAGLWFAAGATVFVVTDALLDRVTAANPTGFALLAGVTLDGVPENVALGVSLNAAGSLALLVAGRPAPRPERAAGMVEGGHPRHRAAHWSTSRVTARVTWMTAQVSHVGPRGSSLSTVDTISRWPHSARNPNLGWPRPSSTA